MMRSSTHGDEVRAFNKISHLLSFLKNLWGLFTHLWLPGPSLRRGLSLRVVLGLCVSVASLVAEQGSQLCSCMQT